MMAIALNWNWFIGNRWFEQVICTFKDAVQASVKLFNNSKHLSITMKIVSCFKLFSYYLNPEVKKWGIYRSDYIL